MDLSEARRRFAAARTAHLATVRPDGAPHIVPIVFALHGDVIYSVVDDKPKRTRDLQRLDNIASEPRSSVLVDRYDEDWTALWWVRADGRARVARDGRELDRAIELLAHRYPQEAGRPPLGPAILIDVERWRSWEAAEPDAGGS